MTSFAPEAPSAPDPIPDVPLRAPRGGVSARDRVAAHALASDIARLHSDALLRTARKASICADDAHDAYQRSLELLLQHAGSIDRAKAVGWMHVVVRREAAAIKRARGRTVPLEPDDVDRAARNLSGAVDDHVHAIDLAQRAGEALATLKDSQAQALCLRAQGMSYEEIGEAYDWSYTKVNRTVTEGRRAFVDHYLAVERGTVCSTTTAQIQAFAADELGVRDAVRVRGHLVRCSGCRALLHAERRADASLRALLPPAFLVVGAGSRHVGGPSWIQEHLLAPLGHAAGRLHPAVETLTGSKLGVVAASSLAIAGGSVAVEHEVRRAVAAPQPVLRGSIVAAPATASTNASKPGPEGGLQAVVSAAVTKDRELAAARLAAADRRRAKRQAAARSRARAAAGTPTDFSTAGGEFAGSAKHAPGATGGVRRASAAGSGASAASPADEPTEVVTSAPSDTDSVAVSVDAGTPRAGAESGGSDEFSP